MVAAEVPAVHPADEYMSALHRLDELRSASTQGNWQPIASSGEHWHIHVEGEMVASIASNDGSNEVQRPANAILIAMLHRTIDAQVALLNEALDMEKSLGSLAEFSAWHHETLALARAINGTS